MIVRKTVSEIDLVRVLFRWMHIGSVIVLVGGAVFQRFFVMPAATSLPEAEHQALKDRVLARWRILVHVLITLILISGFYNLIKMAREVTSTWHMLIGVKILLALVVFFIASALVGRSKGLQPIRDQAFLWLGVNVALAAAIVMISGVLRYLPPKASAQREDQPSSAVVRPVATSNSLSRGTSSASTANP
jgi:uncharacterized membrane protein